MQQTQDDNKPKSRQQRKQVDIGDLGPVQFNVTDKFDMFRPNLPDTIDEHEEEHIQDTWGEQTFPICEAIFAPGNSSVDLYFSMVSALEYLFVRNYTSSQTLKQIPLDYFPMCMHLTDFSHCAKELDLPVSRGGGLQALVAIGTNDGRAIVYKIDNTQADKVVCKTKFGMSFGKITSLNVTDNGFTLIVASEAGEIMSYDLKEPIKSVEWK